jgi:hypothetical protein
MRRTCVRLKCGTTCGRLADLHAAGGDGTGVTGGSSSARSRRRTRGRWSGWCCSTRRASLRSPSTTVCTRASGSMARCSRRRTRRSISTPRSTSSATRRRWARCRSSSSPQGCSRTGGSRPSRCSRHARRIASLSSDSIQVLDRGKGHFLPTNDPKIVEDATLAVVHAVRSDAALPPCSEILGTVPTAECLARGALGHQEVHPNG